MRRLAVLVLFVGVACTGSSGASSSTAPPVPASPSPSPVAVDGDRLLVVRDDGNLETLDPNGGEVLALTTDAGPDVVVDQPVSSPDGRSIAWVELRSDGPRVVTTSRAGGNRREIPLTVAPFFLAWDPTSMRIAYLGNAGAGIGLGVIDDAVVQPRDVPVGGGAPLYLAWSPDGTQLLVHVGADGLGRDGPGPPAAPERRCAGHVPGARVAPRRARALRGAPGRRPEPGGDRSRRSNRPAPVPRRRAVRAEPRRRPRGLSPGRPRRHGNGRLRAGPQRRACDTRDARRHACLLLVTGRAIGCCC